MKIGNLYKIERYGWFLFPEKDIGPMAVITNFWMEDSKSGRNQACFLTQMYKTEIAYLEQGNCFVLLEQYKNLKKILSIYGQIGWISIYSNNEKYCFREM